jgi:hypothetical protein
VFISEFLAVVSHTSFSQIDPVSHPTNIYEHLLMCSMLLGLSRENKRKIPPTSVLMEFRFKE